MEKWVFEKKAPEVQLSFPRPVQPARIVLRGVRTEFSDSRLVLEGSNDGQEWDLLADMPETVVRNDGVNPMLERMGLAKYVDRTLGTDVGAFSFIRVRGVARDGDPAALIRIDEFSVFE